MTKKDKNRRRQARKKRQSAKLKDGARQRHVFNAKVRSGDAAKISLAFSGKPVPIDMDHPEELAERAAQDEAWAKAGHPVKGTA